MVINQTKEMLLTIAVVILIVNLIWFIFFRHLYFITPIPVITVVLAIILIAVAMRNK